MLQITSCLAAKGASNGAKVACLLLKYVYNQLVLRLPMARMTSKGMS